MVQYVVGSYRFTDVYNCIVLFHTCIGETLYHRLYTHEKYQEWLQFWNAHCSSSGFSGGTELHVNRGVPSPFKSTPRSDEFENCEDSTCETLN